MPFMPSNPAANPLRDILHHIDLAAYFVEGIDYPAFRDNRMDLDQMVTLMRGDHDPVTGAMIAGEPNMPNIPLREAIERFMQLSELQRKGAWIVTDNGDHLSPEYIEDTYRSAAFKAATE
jgi:hypothetical protein